MYNIRIPVKEVSQISNPDERVFSAIFSNGVIKCNCFIEPAKNPYTITDIINKLDLTAKVSYVNPPLEKYLTLFRPMLDKMVSQAYPTYAKLLDKDDLLSILFLTIVKLYNKNYYLHNRLIYKSFINELNMEIRNQKHFTDMQSLNVICDTEDQNIELIDTLVDPDESEIAYQLSHYTDKDYDLELFQRIKSAMLREMSPLAFDRILIQLKSKTVDTNTSRILSRFRQMYKEGKL